MKRLPPSIQEETRYLKFRIHAEETVKFPDTVDRLWDTLMDEIGAIDLSKADVWIIKNKYDENENTGVIRVNKEMEDKVRSALLFLEHVDNQEVYVEIEKTSGMIDKL